MLICAFVCQNVQIMIQHLEAYLTTCQFAHVDVKWTNCDSTLASLFNMLMSICKCWMNKLFTWHGFCFPCSFKMNKFSFHVFMRCGMNSISVSAKTEWNFLITWWFDFKIHVMSLWLGSLWQKANLTNPSLLSITVLEQGVKELYAKVGGDVHWDAAGSWKSHMRGWVEAHAAVAAILCRDHTAAGVASRGWW